MLRMWLDKSLNNYSSPPAHSISAPLMVSLAGTVNFAPSYCTSDLGRRIIRFTSFLQLWPSVQFYVPTHVLILARAVLQASLIWCDMGKRTDTDTQ